jgi:hypothetical protein
MNLNQQLKEDNMYYCTREKAYQMLKKLTKQDFGYDVEKWKQWIKETKFPRNYLKDKPRK